jgi:hypothetical protein
VFDMVEADLVMMKNDHLLFPLNYNLIG